MSAYLDSGGRRRIPARAHVIVIVMLLIIAAFGFALLAELPPFRSNTEVSEPRPAPTPVAPPTDLPQRTFEPGLKDAYPEVFAYVNEFLETCLAGDYAGYRLHVSRMTTPETRERFTRLYHSMESVHVEMIEELPPDRLPDLPPPVYRVISRVDFKPDSRVTLRSSNRKPAMLVFREAGDWRMMPAPPSLQPSDPESQPASDEAEAPIQTHYPWDVEPDK